MVSTGMVVATGIRDLGSMQALNTCVQNIEEFNTESFKNGCDYFVERVVLPRHLWTLRRASGDQTNTRAFWDRRRPTPVTPGKNTAQP